MFELFNDYEPYRIFVYVMTFVFGIFIGSFLNVVALRLLKEESIVFPGSHCPKCKEPIKFYDNIPILSYIILMGKCRHCKEKISIQYPLVEFSTGVLFFLCIYSFGISFQAIGMMIVICSLVVITVTDLYERLIFDVTSLTLIPLGLLYNLLNLGQVSRPPFKFPIMPSSINFEVPGLLENGSLILPGIFISAIVGIIVAIVFFEGFSYLGELFLGKYGFGMGDTKLCAGLAAWFGWENLLLIIFISFISQAFIGIPLMLYNNLQDKDYKSFFGLIITLLAAFGPFIFGNLFPVPKDILLILTLICFVVVAVGLVIVLKQTKKRQSYTYLPLGPAIVIGALIVMFYGEFILSWYFKLFN